MKCTKKIMLAIGLSCFAYIGYKGARLAAAISGLSKDLPQYLNNTFGERPSLSMTVIWKRCKIVLGFSAETLEKNPELETQVIDYIKRFYPAIGKLKLKVLTKEREKKE
ncbi:MAG: hypothetical protein R6U84_06180 [Candidatus Cloacimonadales bacterium]